MNLFRVPSFSILIIFFFHSLSYSQVSISIDSLSNQELFDSHEITPDQILEELNKRYIDTSERDNATRMELARLISRQSYQQGKIQDVPYWQNIADSLAVKIDDNDYDKEYGFHKIAYQFGVKHFNDAKRLLEEMEPHAMNSGDTLWMLQYYTRRSRLFNSIDDAAEALKALYAAESLNEEYKDDHQKAMLLAVRGDIYWENRENQKSLDKYLESASLYQEVGETANCIPIYRNIITQAMELKQKDIALEYNDRLSELQRIYATEIGYFTGEVNNILLLIQLEEYRKAIAQARKTIAYADSTGRDESHAIYLMGIAHRGIDDYSTAATLIQRAFDIGKENGHHGKCSFYAHALYQTYYWKQRYSPALDWFQTHIQYRDSVYNEKKAQEIAVFESKLESLEKKRQVELLEAKIENEKQKKQKLWLLIISITALSFIFLYAQRQRSQKERLQQEALLMQSEMENEKLRQSLEFKQKELASQIINMTNKNSLLSRLKTGLMDIKSRTPSNDLSALIRTIERGLESNTEWDNFYKVFKSIHSSFIGKLNALSDELTSNDIRLASLLKMNLSSKQISTMLNISEAGVKKARYRLRKKMQLESDVNIQDYLLSL